MRSTPSISADGSLVALTALSGDRQRVLVRDVRKPRAAPEVASRADGADGAEADAPASYPSISADGRLVAFSSLAANLARAKPDDRRGVFVRDRHAHTTTLVNVPSPAPAGGASDKAGITSSPASSPLSQPRQSAVLVDIFDNAFQPGRYTFNLHDPCSGHADDDRRWLSPGATA